MGDPPEFGATVSQGAACPAATMPAGAGLGDAPPGSAAADSGGRGRLSSRGSRIARGEVPERSNGRSRNAPPQVSFHVILYQNVIILNRLRCVGVLFHPAPFRLVSSCLGPKFRMSL
jgi:hypothetical protein